MEAVGGCSGEDACTYESQRELHTSARYEHEYNTRAVLVARRRVSRSHLPFVFVTCQFFTKLDPVKLSEQLVVTQPSGPAAVFLVHSVPALFTEAISSVGFQRKKKKKKKEKLHLGKLPIFFYSRAQLLVVI